MPLSSVQCLNLQPEKYTVYNKMFSVCFVQYVRTIADNQARQRNERFCSASEDTQWGLGNTRRWDDEQQTQFISAGVSCSTMPASDQNSNPYRFNNSLTCLLFILTGSAATAGGAELTSMAPLLLCRKREGSFPLASPTAVTSSMEC